MSKEKIVNRGTSESRRFIKYRPEKDLSVLQDVRQIVPGGEIERAMVHLVDEQDFLGVFLKEASFYPVLPEETQLALARLLYHGQAAEETLKSRPHLSAPKKEELKDLFEWGQEAKDRLVKHNLRLVFKVAKKHQRRAGELTFSDLIQEGVLGFIRGLDQFDPYQGYAVSTYTIWWINQAVTRAIADKGRLVRLPVQQSGEVIRMYRAISQLRQKLGREPNIEEIAKLCRQSQQYIGDLLQVVQQPVSLEKPVGEDEESELGDFIVDPAAEASITSYVDRKFLEEAVQTFLDTLSERGRTILMLRFGLRDGRPMTFENLARYLGVTRERVRQIETQILERLTPQQKNILMPFYDSGLVGKEKHGKAR